VLPRAPVYLLVLAIAQATAVSCTMDFDAPFSSSWRGRADAGADVSDAGKDTTGDVSKGGGGSGGKAGAGGSSAAGGTGGAAGSSGAGGTGGAASVCGNGATEPGEACDDGFTTACGPCNAQCTGPGAESVCGDGQVCPDTEACDDGHTTDCGSCNAACSGAGTASVCGDGTVCADTESCDDGHTTACGDCNADCTGAGSGSTCGDGTLCEDTETCDDGNMQPCDGCNATCTGQGDPTTCGCASGPADDVFDSGMVGCKGKVTWSNRENLCGSGLKACTAQQWVNLHAGKAPSYEYWTDDALQYKGPSATCYVVFSGGSLCSPTSSPMRVCTGASDSLGNTCTWWDCGFQAASPNEYFGGCSGGTTTAGTLCCPQ
jgi:cysteine-rich repeat protein